MDTADAKSQKGLSGDLFKDGQISGSRGCVGLWRHYAPSFEIIIFLILTGFADRQVLHGLALRAAFLYITTTITDKKGN